MGMGLYAAVAIVAAVAIFLLAEWLRMPGVPAPDNPALLAIVAGLLWPVLLVGAAQWAVIAGVASRMRRTAPAVRVVSAPGIPQPTSR